MKKALYVAVACAFVWGILCATPVLAADKIGYVDLSKLFDEYGKTKEYDKVLGDKQKLYEAERDGKIKEIKDLQDKYNLLNDKEKEAKKGDLEKKIMALQQYDQEKQAVLEKDRNERIKEILKDIEDAVRQYAEKEGYTIVLNDRVLIYQSKSLDITARVLEILSKSDSAKK